MGPCGRDEGRETENVGREEERKDYEKLYGVTGRSKGRRKGGRSKRE